MNATVATLRTAGADAWANRASFGFQCGFMVANDVTWLVFWAIFFSRTGTIRGWTVHDVFLLFAVLTVSAGVAVGVLANSRRIGHLVAQGALDEILTLPVRPLPALLTRRVDATNVGDLIFGCVIFILLGAPTPARAAGFVVACLCASTILVGFFVVCGSLTLFVGGRGEQTDLALNAVVIFSSYPIDVFSGPTKILLFTVIPAAFVTSLPTRLVQHFTLSLALSEAGAAAVAAIAGWAVFTLGLRRYSSGSLWAR